MPSKTRPQDRTNYRPDLEVPVEQWGTIKGATDKVTWFACIDAAIVAEMVPRSFLHLAVRMATQWLNKESGLTWRSAANLASDIDMAKSTVEGLLEVGVAVGLLVKVKRGKRGRGKRTAIYRPAIPDVLIPDGPGFKLDEKPGGPGFSAPVKRSRKSRFEQPANPDFGPSKYPAHRDDLPVEVIPEDIIPVAAPQRGANTARGDSSNTTRADSECADGSSAVPEPLASQPSAPDGAWSEPDIAPRSTSSLPRQPPNRDNPAPSVGRPPNGSHADADAERTAVLDHSRKVLGAGCEALVARFHDAERALDPDSATERVFDLIDVAANEDDPVACIENAINIAEGLGRQAAYRQ
ncbi:hypothetical protein ACVI1L_008494 [Bradyrhizobium sp. USDA 4516]